MNDSYVKFGAEVQRLIDSGVSEGKAIMQAREKFGSGYNQWCLAGRPRPQKQHDLAKDVTRFKFTGR